MSTTFLPLVLQEAATGYTKGQLGGGVKSGSMGSWSEKKHNIGTWPRPPQKKKIRNTISEASTNTLTAAFVSLGVTLHILIFSVGPSQLYLLSRSLLGQPSQWDLLSRTFSVGPSTETTIVRQAEWHPEAKVAHHVVCVAASLNSLVHRL